MSEYEIAQTSTRGLASAILLQAILDYRALKSGQATEREDINMEELNEFFSSAWFAELCETCDIDKKTILQNLDKSTL